MTQYIKISSEEQLFGAKSLLESQANMLTAIQHLDNYRNLRAEEIKMRILLKKIIAEAKDCVSTLDKVLPASPAPEEKIEEEEIEVLKIPKAPKIIKIVRLTKDEKETVSPIEQELDDIKKKLARLG